MGAPERGNDLDPRQDEIRMGEDGGRVEPLQARFAEYVDLLVIDGEVCRDTVPTPPWVATTESNGVSSDQVGVDGAAPDDQERCAWSRAGPDPGRSSFATIGSYRAVVTNLMGWAVRVRSGADQRHHGSGNTYEVVRIVSSKVHQDPDLHLRAGDRNGERTAYSSIRGVTVRRSDADDVDEIAEPGEVVGISGVERQAVGVRGGGDEQVGNPPSM